MSKMNFDKEIKTLTEQEILLDQEVRSILSHAMLGDDHAAEISKETFDLCISRLCEFIWKVKRKAYHEGAELIEP